MNDRMIEFLGGAIVGAISLGFFLYIGVLTDHNRSQYCQENGWQKLKPVWMIEAEKNEYVANKMN